jgi:heme exporter protein CcmD
MTTLQQFFHMGGYAFYVWMSYGSVAMLLTMQWFISWRRWRDYLKTQRKYS